jgi:hypothetical protein
MHESCGGHKKLADAYANKACGFWFVLLQPVSNWNEDALHAFMTCGATPDNCILSTDRSGKKEVFAQFFLKTFYSNSKIGFILIMINAFNGLSVVDVYGHDFDAFCGAGNRLRQVVFDEGS